MEYKLWLKQTGEGCDYTVGCGNKLYDLASCSEEAALIEVKEILSENTHSECRFNKAYLLTMADDVSALADDAWRDYLNRQDEWEKEKKRETLARLKRELGE